MEYVQIRRMEKARKLLKTSKLSITDNSVSKFIEAFKKIEGQLPSDFREN